MNSKKARALRKIAHKQTTKEMLTSPLGVKADMRIANRKSYQALKRWYKSLTAPERMKIGRVHLNKNNSL